MSLDLVAARGFAEEIAACSTLQELQDVKVKYLGKKGLITLLNKGLRDISAEERPKVGQEIFEIRTAFDEQFNAKEEAMKTAELSASLTRDAIDITMPGFPFPTGSLHPVTRAYFEIVDIFASMGFSVATGPEVEDDFHNFEALNMPKAHPARDMQDTFYVSEDVVMRTHTSPVQVRVMESQTPPIKIIAPGKVYRCDYDVTHTPMFHQVEGLLVDERTTFGDLKGILTLFIQRMFGEEIGVRFRPSFFPFTEPSAEVDMGCVICGAKGCRVCKGTGWLEILGCGMVDPAVFKMVNIDPEKYRGFAFGMGIERIAMLKYGIDDLRLFFENHQKFLKQF